MNAILAYIWSKGCSFLLQLDLQPPADLLVVSAPLKVSALLMNCSSEVRHDADVEEQVWCTALIALCTWLSVCTVPVQTELW